MTAQEIYTKETGNKAPNNQIAYHEWHIEYVKWLEHNVVKLFALPDVSVQVCECNPHTYYKWEIDENKCYLCNKPVFKQT